MIVYGVYASIPKEAVAFFKVFFWHSIGNIEETHGIISRVSIRIPSECKSRKPSLRQPAGPPRSRDYAAQTQLQNKAEVNTKRTPKTTDPFSFSAWRSHLPTLPRHETLRTELHRKVSNPKKCRAVAGQTSLLTERQAAEI